MSKALPELAKPGRPNAVAVALLVLAAFFIPVVLTAPSALAQTVVATVTLPAGGVPYYAAYDSGKGEIFVANYGSNTVNVISDSTNTVGATVKGVALAWGAAYCSGNA